jgi:hypothetical protein
MISGEEVMLKDQSIFKTSTGNEAATKSLGMGVVTHTIQGEASFIVWSMDVMFEGANIPRHLDMMGQNEQSAPPSPPPWPYTDKMTAAFGAGGKCEGMEDLRLQQYKEPCEGGAETGHHLIPGRCLLDTPNYNHDNAPVICVSKGNQHQGSHKACHALFDPVEQAAFDNDEDFSYADARSAAAASAGGATTPERTLNEKEQGCVAFQLDQYYRAKPPNGPGLTNNSPLRASGAPGKVAAPTLPIGEEE